MGLLSTIFGESGRMAEVFGGLTIVIAAFIFMFLILILVSKRVSGENIVLFSLLFLILIMSYGLWAIPAVYIMTPFVFLMLYVAYYAYYTLYKPD
jgi:hypothetical protein